jgi:hypothetical protein
MKTNTPIVNQPDRRASKFLFLAQMEIFAAVARPRPDFLPQRLIHQAAAD